MSLLDVVALSKVACEVSLRAELKYATTDNLVGRPLAGYDPRVTDVALLTPKAAAKLCEVQNYLVNKHNYGLIIYDAYRPKQAVLDLMNWAKQPIITSQDHHLKDKHFPRVGKDELFHLGYIAEDSNHCYGNTVDVFLWDLAANRVLDMGAVFDFMDEMSNLAIDPELLLPEAYQHRLVLLEAMELFGFHSYEKEFWHFCHGGEDGREVSQPLNIEITKEELQRLKI